MCQGGTRSSTNTWEQERASHALSWNGPRPSSGCSNLQLRWHVDGDQKSCAGENEEASEPSQQGPAVCAGPELELANNRSGPRAGDVEVVTAVLTKGQSYA